MPVGLYQIEVLGNDQYQPMQKTVNIVNEEDKDEIIVFVGLKPRIDTSIEFMFFTGEPNYPQKLKPQTVEAKAILLPTPIAKKNNNFDEIELEDYEFDILWDESRQL